MHADEHQGARGGMFVSQVQQLLQGIYDAASAYCVRDFLITDAHLAQRLEGAGARPGAERLLLLDDGDELALSLYLEAEVLSRLEGIDPARHLALHHLSDFWTVLEGVSHFVYLTWSAGFERSVTPLELEMQAEVDKFVSAGLLLGEAERPPRELHRRLFESYRFADGLSAEQRELYRAASSLAARYCRMLERRFLATGDREGLMRELRRFWRLNKSGKIGRIRELDAGA